MTDQQVNAARQTPAAILAIAQHMTDRELPPFASLDATGEGLTVWVTYHDAVAWLETVHVDQTTVEHLDGDTVRHTADVRLPDTGVTFKLRTAYFANPLEETPGWAAFRDYLRRLASNGGEATVTFHADAVDGHTEDWHRPCVSDDGCDLVVCLDTKTSPHDGAVEACEHGYCESHRSECSECAGHARADVRF